jgi:AraC family transcriptional regulator of adaptative response/methylated-DNA-[protein]-cysteine methyltransferase
MNAQMTETAIDDERRWQAVREKDARFDGQFYLGVRTTGVYCRPVCGARTPKRENVRFFDTMDDAERAGFRPCKRCRPRDENPNVRAALVEAAIRDIEAHLDEGALDLASLSARLGCSQFHLQRTFKALTSVSPRQYVAARRMERLKANLQGGRDVTTAGYGSSSGLYEKSVPVLGMTPSRYRRGGEALSIGVATRACAFGHILVAATDRGLCAVRLGDDPARLRAELNTEFAAAEIHEDESLGVVVEHLLDSLAGRGTTSDLALDIRMTAFQQRVWTELQAIPAGETRTYAEVAQAIGAPSAVRAVAGACAANPVALLVPCHRVVRTDGGLGGYRWGIERKRRLLEAEREATLATA